MPNLPLRAKIITAEDFHPEPEGFPDLSPAARTLVWHSEHFRNSGYLPPFENNIDHSIEVEVHVSAGRWCAPCPWCPASEYPSSVHPVFMCSQCHNNGSLVWVLVKWPKNRWEIEEVLSLRPVAQTRNWIPGEDVMNLVKENEEQLGVRGTYEHMNYERPAK